MWTPTAVLKAVLAAQALLRPQAVAAYQLHLSARQPGSSLPEIPECLRDKTVYLVGNSISRGMYFSLVATLDNGTEFSPADPLWTNRLAQKKLCIWGPVGLLSCKYRIKPTGTRVVTSMAQRLEQLEEHLEKASSKMPIDMVVVEVGMDHAAYQIEVNEQGLHGFEVNMDARIGGVISLMRELHRSSHTSFIWRAVSHFNQSAAWDPKWTNANVDLWNKRLFGHLESSGLLKEPWFRWYELSKERIDQALAREEGYAMEDWIHPNSHTLYQMVKDIMPSLC